MTHKTNRHKTNRHAYVIIAINRETGRIQGYHKCNIAHVGWTPGLTGNIWDAYFAQDIHGAHILLNLCKETVPEYDWKIQKAFITTQDIDD